MDYQDLFLTNAGRLNRQPFWIGSIILFVVNIVAGIIIGLVSWQQQRRQLRCRDRRPRLDLPGREYRHQKIS